MLHSKQLAPYAAWQGHCLGRDAVAAIARQLHHLEQLNEHLHLQYDMRIQHRACWDQWSAHIHM
jgi:hypothetical protein